VHLAPLREQLQAKPCQIGQKNSFALEAIRPLLENALSRAVPPGFTTSPAAPSPLPSAQACPGGVRCGVPSGQRTDDGGARGRRNG
jgi:hypothetical protein